MLDFWLFRVMSLVFQKKHLTKVLFWRTLFLLFIVTLISLVLIRTSFVRILTTLSICYYINYKRLLRPFHNF